MVNIDAVRPRVAVVILTYNGGTKPIRAVESLLASGDDADIMVWDNGSADDSGAGVERRYPEVFVHRHPTNLGVASGRNAAASLAVERFAPTHLLFLDDDMEVRTGFVQGLVNPFLRDPSVGQTQAKLMLRDAPTHLNDGGGCRIRFWLGTTQPVGFGEPDNGQYDTPKDCVACGGAMMVRVDVFQQLGGFDAIFNPFGPEDLDFSLRLQKAGYRAIYSPSAVAVHVVSGTFDGGKGSPVYTQKRIEHWLRFLRRHGSPLDKLGFYLIGAPYRAARMIVRAIRSKNIGIVRGILRSVAAPGGKASAETPIHPRPSNDHE